MKKIKLFDVIVYRVLLSIPVSCVVNLIYGFILFLARWSWTISHSSSLNSFQYSIFVILTSVAAIVPFALLNITRYLAIKRGYLKYGIKELLLSSVLEYLFFEMFMLFEYIT